MLISLDSGDPQEVMQVKKWGFIIDKVTTNPTTISRTISQNGGSVKDVVIDISKIVPNVPISVEAIGTQDYDVSSIDHSVFVQEASIISSWHPNFVVKIPAIKKGFDAAKAFGAKFRTNFTLIFSLEQALAADHGASYVSPFVGRYDAKRHEFISKGILNESAPKGMDMIDSIVKRFSSQGISTLVLTASTRKNIGYIEEAHRLGSHMITMPFEMFEALNESNMVDWLNMKRSVPKTQKNTKPAFSYSFNIDLLFAMERELINDGLEAFLNDAKKADYSIL